MHHASLYGFAHAVDDAGTGRRAAHGGGERTKKISLPDCYRIWAESAATEAQGYLLGGQLRGLLYAMLPVRLTKLSARAILCR